MENNLSELDYLEICLQIMDISCILAMRFTVATHIFIIVKILPEGKWQRTQLNCTEQNGTERNRTEQNMIDGKHIYFHIKCWMCFM